MTVSIAFTHGMHEDVAAAVGERAALVYNRIAYWVEANEAAQEHVYKDESYAKVPAEKIGDKFPWLSDRQVRGCILKLVEAGFLSEPVDGDGQPVNLSRNKFDKAKWYRLGPKPTVTSKLPNGEFEETKASVGSDQTVSSYKDNTPSHTPSHTERPKEEKKGNPPSLAKSDFHEAVQAYLEPLVKHAGGSRVSPPADLGELAAVCRKTGHPPRLVMGAVLAFYQSKEIAQQDPQFRPRVSTALREQRFVAYLKTPAPAVPAEVQEWDPIAEQAEMMRRTLEATA